MLRIEVWRDITFKMVSHPLPHVRARFCSFLGCLSLGEGGDARGLTCTESAPLSQAFTRFIKVVLGAASILLHNDCLVTWKWLRQPDPPGDP